MSPENFEVSALATPIRVIEVGASGELASRYSTSIGTFTAAAAGDYADNDVMSNDAGAGAGDPIVFANAVRQTGGSAKVVGASILYTAAAAFVPTSELLLFAAAPTATEMDDNAAFTAVDAADLSKYIGSIAFAAGTDIGPGTLGAPATLTPAAPLFIRSDTTTIYGILVLRDAETAETAGMGVTITLHIEH